MNNYKLSIIILTWNTAEITRSCVESLVCKIKNIPYEIIVVDNGSTDDTSKIFSKLTSVKYINTGSNLGFSKGNNFGVSQAVGDYFLFLNSDMEYLTGLDQMFSYYKQHPNIGLIGPQLLNLDHTPQGSIFPPQTPFNAFKEFWLNQPSFSKYFLTKITDVNAISGGAILLKKSLFTQINGWDEKYYFYYEDLAMCRTIHSLNLRVSYFPECQFIHHHGASVKKLTVHDSGTLRLIKSSQIFHGKIQHFLINFIIWSGQKVHKTIRS